MIPRERFDAVNAERTSLSEKVKSFEAQVAELTKVREQFEQFKVQVSEEQALSQHGIKQEGYEFIRSYFGKLNSKDKFTDWLKGAVENPPEGLPEGVAVYLRKQVDPKLPKRANLADANSKSNQVPENETQEEYNLRRYKEDQERLKNQQFR